MKGYTTLQLVYTPPRGVYTPPGGVYTPSGRVYIHLRGNADSCYCLTTHAQQELLLTQFTVITGVYSRFPDGYFPQMVFSRKDVSRKVVSRMTFPGKTIPGWSLYCHNIVDNCSTSGDM